ncbi:hypothetical protein LHJ74_23460 [Streptomyces sp. N2-109]|uniref:Secreted protein n=1 Tax=Streptomyces gossypii TaxID=2883101 RepID=A0ABT2JZL8_9ACTN|nr:hypothetical protein [Streptomyces gossypii]MCT2592834.1 hypothetical protein [Streptomyces gossypii]
MTSVLTTVLVLGAVGGGITYTALTASGADRTAATDVWRKPDKTPSADDPARNRAKGRTDTELSAQLLPVPDGYQLGPDADFFGNDVVRDADEANKYLLEQQYPGISEAERKKHLEQFKIFGVQGSAKRSYARDNGELVFNIEIIPMKAEAVGPLTARLKVLAEREGFRKGPKIEGYDDAFCFLTSEVKPESGDSSEPGIDAMACSGYRGNTRVYLTAIGGAPLPEGEVAQLLQKQLDRVDLEGEDV